MLLEAENNLSSKQTINLENISKDLNISIKKLNNLTKLKSKNDFVLLNGKELYSAYKGKGGYKKAHNNIRSIMALYKLKITLITQKEINITKNEDLKGKKIAFFDDMSLSVTKPILDTIEVGTKGEILDLNKSIKAIQDKKIDVLFMLSTDNYPALHKILNSTNTHLQSFRSKKITQLIRSSHFYSKATIKKELDKHINSDIITIGVKMILATSIESDKELVYKFTKKLLKSFEELKKSDPLYSNLSRKSALEELAIPQHPQAIKAFNETPDK